MKLIAMLVLIPLLSFGGDYSLTREATKLTPGGGSPTNVLSWTCQQNCGVEIQEVHVYGGTLTDTATVTRVSYDGYVTNTVATLTYTSGASASTATITYGNLTWYPGRGKDRCVITGTGTNAFYTAFVYRAHP